MNKLQYINRLISWIPGMLVLLVALYGVHSADHPGLPVQLEGMVIAVENNDTTQVENARVFLVGVPAQMGYTADQDRRLMDQVNQTFTPHVLPAAAGEEVTFKNSDPSNHNVRLIRDGDDKMLMNKMTYPGQSATYTFSKQGLVHVRCDIHPNMHAYIPVVGGPFLLSRSNQDGSFAFSRPDSLSGRSVTVKAWAEQFGWSEEKKVTLRPAEESRPIQLTF